VKRDESQAKKLLTLVLIGMPEIPRVDTDPRFVSWFDRNNRRQRKIEEREKRRNAAADAAAAAPAPVAAAKPRRSTIYNLLNAEPVQGRRMKRARHSEKEVEDGEEDTTVVPKPRKIEVKDLVQVRTVC